MKKTLLLTLAFCCTVSFAPSAFHCPVTGLTQDAKRPTAKITALNRLKNRTTTPTNIDNSITLESILAHGNDTGRFSNSKAITITGFITDVKSGGAEDCNCYYGKDPYIDTHIEIAASATETNKKKMMVVEITPRIKATHDKWNTKELKKLIGKQVTVTGWMMFDNNHWQNSLNTNPNGGNVYRATAWEIHPVMDLEVVQ